MSQIKLTIAKNGPLRVSDPAGLIELVDHEGMPIVPANPAQFSICRCGASANKPFCDGKHTKIGFDTAAAVVPESAE